jgi:hypothetical protein
MNPYSYTISLRIWHPTIDPEDITKKLKMSPNRTWIAGAQRTTPKGTMLKGNYKESYWYATIHDDEELYSDDIELEKYIEKFTKSIEIHSEFFNEIRASKGRVEYFVGLYVDSNSGIELPYSLLSFLGELGIDLSFDIYPEKKEE